MPSENAQPSFRDGGSYSFTHVPSQFQLDKNRKVKLEKVWWGLF